MVSLIITLATSPHQNIYQPTRMDILLKRAYNISKESKEGEDGENGSCKDYKQGSDYNSY